MAAGDLVSGVEILGPCDGREGLGDAEVGAGGRLAEIDADIAMGRGEGHDGGVGGPLIRGYGLVKTRVHNGNGWTRSWVGYLRQKSPLKKLLSQRRFYPRGPEISTG